MTWITGLIVQQKCPQTLNKTQTTAIVKKYSTVQIKHKKMYIGNMYLYVSFDNKVN